MHFRTFFSSLCTSAAVLVCAVRGYATPDFPAALQKDLGLSYTPQCTLCHSSLSGGKGTAVQPFGKAMIARGLAEYNEESLKNALAALGAERTDSNHNGISDIQELGQGKDPNPNGGTPEPPQYGCVGSTMAVMSHGKESDQERHGDVVLLSVLLIGMTACIRCKRR